MITIYSQTATASTPSTPSQGPQIASRPLGPREAITSNPLWIDLYRPTAEEDSKCETHLGIDIPTRSDINYVEPAGSLYASQGSRYLSAKMIHDAEGSTSSSSVIFILTSTAIVTVRYHDYVAFNLFARRLADADAESISPEAILAGLINTLVDWTAQQIDLSGHQLDEVSTKIFGINDTSRNHNSLFKAALGELGQQSKRISDIRESLVSLERVLLFLAPDYQSSRVPAQLRDDVRATLRDLQSLEEHATFQTQKVQFLLDTTMGLINLEQSHIIKLFSVLAVIFMPPTLIASIYGMNFKNLPELDWSYGYPIALALMAASSGLLYLYFRRKRWL